MPSYTSSDPSERLAAVRQAIEECLHAQEYWLGGTGTNRGNRRHLKARLDYLRELEKDLMQEVSDASNGGGCSVAIITPVT